MVAGVTLEGRIIHWPLLCFTDTMGSRAVLPHMLLTMLWALTTITKATALTHQDTTLLKQWKILINFLPLSFISNVFPSWETGWCSLQKWINLKSQAWGRTPLLPTLRGRDRLISENSRPSGLQSEFHSLWAMYRNPFLVFPPKKILPFWKWNWLLRAHKRDTRYMNLNSENPSCSSSIRVFSYCLFRVLNYNNKQNPAINLNAAILQRTWAAIHLKSDSLEEGTTNLDTQT